MHHRLVSLITCVAVLGLATPATAENLEHTRRLLAERVCQGCDLSRAGLIFANLEQVDLSGANLSLANLNRVNLSNANLRGANLTGAVLTHANLQGADLRGADLRGADLREAYLTGVDLTGANLEGANLIGAIDIPTRFLTPETLYTWGLLEAQRGNFEGAIKYLNDSLSMKPDFAHVYLARGVIRFRNGDLEGAIQDAQQAEQLYRTQGNAQGEQLSLQFVARVQAVQEDLEDQRTMGSGGSNFLNMLGGLAGLLLRFLL